MKALAFVGLSCLVLLVSDWLLEITVTEGWDIYHLMVPSARLELALHKWQGF